MTRLICLRFRFNEVRLWLKPDRLQPGKPVAAIGAADEDRELVAYEPAETAGEDGWPVDQARPVLLAAPGGESSDAVAIREHGAPIAALPVPTG